ncbi:hypothetical protein E2562_027549 [Oryza meyeriana var. granulata]|uniref:Uncharacterized protein n=1 Tax=Oryza meyeriana var. granulata TaxID=110450 RepID=A0A6G1CJ84_9ORYZ|nr:hypothetical protein E2562_027549 [Oryza meyeriana var. granulata]
MVATSHLLHSDGPTAAGDSRCLAEVPPPLHHAVLEANLERPMVTGSEILGARSNIAERK